MTTRHDAAGVGEEVWPPFDHMPFDLVEAEGGPDDAAVLEVIHLLGRLSPQVYGFLEPAVRATTGFSVRQTVLVLDDPHSRELLDLMPAEALIHRIPCSRWPLVNLMRMNRQLGALLAQRRFGAVHLHGLKACAAGAWALHAKGQDEAVFFSPHSSRLLTRFRWLAKPVVAACERLLGRRRFRAIASMSAEAQRWSQVSDFPVDVVESPVSMAFFRSSHRESQRPLIVSGGRVTLAGDAEAAFLQMAVLLCDYLPQTRFVWLGHVDAKLAPAVKAAGVECIAGADEAVRLSLLSQAWIFVAPAGGRGTPVGLAEAMASAVPCVAAATALNSDLVAHGRNGYLFNRLDEALLSVARLLDNPTLRSELGLAARASADTRFRDLAFRERLVRCYREADVPLRADHPLQQVDVGAAARSSCAPGDLDSGSAGPRSGVGRRFG